MRSPIDATSTAWYVQKRPGWGRLAVWVVATVVGGPIVYLLPQQTLALLDAEGWLLLTIWAIAGVAFGLLAGALVGAVQSRALRGVVPWADQWVRGTVIGWAIGGAIMISLTRLSYSAMISNSNNAPPLLGTIAWFAGGAGIGLGQWLVLRQHVRRAVWWVGATALGWGLGVVVMLIAIQNATQLIEVGGIVGVVMVLLIVGPGVSSIPGVITGLAFYVLIAQNDRNTDNTHP